jgi:hypothetical protein
MIMSNGHFNCLWRTHPELGLEVAEPATQHVHFVVFVLALCLQRISRLGIDL